MSLTTEIQSIAISLGVAFRYGRKYDENINGDDAVFPAIVLLEVDQPGLRINKTTGQVWDRDNIFIQFIDKTVMCEQAIDREEVVSSMKLLAAKFIKELGNSKYFSDFGENINGVLLVDYYDVNVTGIEFNITGLTSIYPYPC